LRSLTEPLFHWYVDSAIGKELVFALYTLPCRYAMCAFCSLPSLAEGGERVTPKHLEAQVDHVLAAYSAEQLAAVAKVSVYTASSALDQVSLPTRSLMYLALKVTDFPALSVLSMETRSEYVEDWELQALAAILGERVTLEIGIGYETRDPHLRNKLLGKGLSDRALRKLCEQLGRLDCQLKAYLMLKPHHSLTEQGGIDEAVDGVTHLAELRDEFDMPVSIHLNPMYIAEGCRLADAMKEAEFEPPELSSVVAVVRESCARGIPIYIGLDDEGLATDGGTFESSGLNREATVAALLSFNRHQDLSRLLAEVR